MDCCSEDTSPMLRARSLLCGVASICTCLDIADVSLVKWPGELIPREGECCIAIIGPSTLIVGVVLDFFLLAGDQAHLEEKTKSHD